MNKQNGLIVLLTLIILLSISLTTYYLSRLNSAISTTIPSPIPTPAPPISPLTLDSIFSPDHSWTKQLPAEQTLTLITTGDVIPARTVNYKMTIYNDFTHPFLKTANLLRQADLTLINLEAPLIKNCPVTNEGMVFCGNQKFLEGLQSAGIDVANLANNHTFNWGAAGIQQTIDLLENNHILTCGFPLNHLTIKKHKNNIIIGFLGWNLLEEIDTHQILDTIKQAKTQVDLLIISAHWGAEYQTFPAPSTQDLAHKIIEAGADLIVGNHPHWIQPVEIYQNKIIFYAHGNFIFDQEWSPETKTGFVAQTTFYQKQIVDVQILPIFISDYNQPELVTGEAKEAILQQLKTVSKQNQPG